MASANSDKLASDQPAASLVAPDCRGMNFYRIDRGLRDLLDLHMEPQLRTAMEPHLDRLGSLLEDGSMNSRKSPTSIRPCSIHAIDSGATRIGSSSILHIARWSESVSVNSGCMRWRIGPGVLGWPAPLPYIAKYAFQYLFVQAEFGLMCPISVTDTGAVLVENTAATTSRRATSAACSRRTWTRFSKARST